MSSISAIKTNLFANIDPIILKKRIKTSQPDFIQPMLATLTTDYFSNPNWIYEHKFDGERCLVFKKRGKVMLLSRNHKNMNAQYPELVHAFENQQADNFIIDGEIVALKKGLSNFELLQSRMNRINPTNNAQAPVLLNIFDVMYANGFDLRQLPLSARKTILKKLLRYNKELLYTPFIKKEGLALFKKACKLHWEGIIAKKFDSTYQGKRSRDWLKFKCIMQQELVIGGYTEPRNSRTDFGALLVGYYHKGQFMYAGKVGTGFNEATLALLGKKLRNLERKTNPFSNYDESTLGVHWVNPKLVAEFQFAEWTKSGKLRVGRYKGLRDDKDAKDVVKEVPKKI